MSTEKHLLFNCPINSYVEIVPNITRKKMKRIMISNMTGMLLIIVETSPIMPGTWFIVRSGLNSLIILMDYIFREVSKTLTHPNTTTKKSSYINI